MEFHISRSIRERLDIDELLFSYTGNVVFADVAASRRLAEKLNKALNPEANPEKNINAGALFAMGLIDELNHALVASYRKDIDPAVLADGIRWFSSKIEPAQMEKLLLAFVEQFPNVSVYRELETPAEWLQGTTDGLSNREAALEELMLLWLSNINPAFEPFRELFADTGLQQQTIYKNVTAALPDYLSTRPPVAPEIGSLFEALRAPMLASPGSLTGQLDFIRERWSKYLGSDIKRILLAIDVLREEDIAIWMRFHPPGPDHHRHAAPGFGGEWFDSDEFGPYDIGPGGERRRRYAEGYQAPLQEYEAFSADQAWMPNVVLIAKSTYVWLEQLSKKYGRHIHRLDQIPDEELQILADRGITGLWLIGLWERSIASRTIKRLRGQTDAVASAYSLKDYNIAEDLGGVSAYENLRDRARNYGLRLASDMVPNHMGIDSPWVIEHPDWFLYRWESPYPAYRFEGPDLSPDSRAEIKIEDHYYDQTDAAVAFRLRSHHDGTTRYIYHGNDGTSFAWNDTAQLDYSKHEVREHVIQTILHVARQFPIIRFDAAMVLAKRHVQRLWFPLPGAGGSIPSRAENSMSQDEFDALMPHEFWREVVDRVAAEVPGTLLLAEAFWLLEGYFVRTLGMHRVYNSAFMNMLRDEENAKYRLYLKKTIEFDPDILKRYVNFMSNPDERTAIDQFGSGDKYFGVCTLLATLPGLPMFGHGQIEGYTERYGMEFKRARMDEWPNEGLVARHQHDIAPLLKNRRIFAESTRFVLYDFWTSHGTVDENVFAYSNEWYGQRSLILYNNRYGSTHGTVHISVAAREKANGDLRQKTLTEGLSLSNDGSVILRYRDSAHNLEYLRRASDLAHHGLRVDLRGYQYMVLLDWSELRSTAEYPWDALCDALNGDGVHNLDEALTKLRLRPLHDVLRQIISSREIQCFADVSAMRPQKGKEARKPEPATAQKTAEKDAAVPSTPETSLDPHLESFVKKSSLFFERALDYLPWEERQAIENPVAESSKESTAKPPAAIDVRESYKQSCEKLAAAAAALPTLEKHFSTTWPAAVRYMLPSNEPGSSLDFTWAPVLAWIVLRSIPGQDLTLSLFDTLHLRSALAETFASLGLEGIQTWQMAARVRALLAHAETSSPFTMLEASFWEDPDIRWLTGVNESGSKTYVNKEQFEEMLSWMQLPALLEISEQGANQPQSLTEVEAAVTAACHAITKAGYTLDKMLPPVTKKDEKTVPKSEKVEPSAELAAAASSATKAK
ncbi:alpha-amylase family glycosyl hydrolase [Acidobacterium sp. S8]|uniref:alpha-amylase family glycosyl hydrolase n=1 Tax=Acidobacterium sp. S8 TaxID=1641854 RepID=UPI00131C4C82|nr:alpha-amylase family glycosyl hydrolase [Acidobacterium sp. S8]